jgi:hypothetical protein
MSSAPLTAVLIKGGQQANPNHRLGPKPVPLGLRERILALDTSTDSLLPSVSTSTKSTMSKKSFLTGLFSLFNFLLSLFHGGGNAVTTTTTTTTTSTSTTTYGPTRPPNCSYFQCQRNISWYDYPDSFKFSLFFMLYYLQSVVLSLQLKIWKS